MIQEREECSGGEMGCAEALGLWCSGTGRGLVSCAERPGSPRGCGEHGPGGRWTWVLLLNLHSMMKCSHD